MTRNSTFQRATRFTGWGKWLFTFTLTCVEGHAAVVRRPQLRAHGSRTYALEVGRMHWTYTNYYVRMYECRSLGLTRIVFLHYNVLIYSLQTAVLYGFRFGLFRSRASDDGSKTALGLKRCRTFNLHLLTCQLRTCTKMNNTAPAKPLQLDVLHYW